MIPGLSRRHLHSFQANRRGYLSFLFLCGLFLVSMFGEFFCNERPLLLLYEERIFIPFMQTYPASDFGESHEWEARYSDSVFQERIEKKGWILWAPVRFSPNTIDQELKKPVPSAPDSRHILGTDDRGRDVFARLLFAFRFSLVFALLLASIGAVLGILIGAVQGYYGSRIDLLGQRLIEIWSSIPELLALMILCSIFQPSFVLILTFLCCMGWMNYTSYVRAEFLRLRQMDFVMSARHLGASSWHVATRHILPHALVPVLTYFPIRVCSGISILASLDFLGLGLPSSTPSLGELLFQGKTYLHCWWILLSSMGALSVIMVLLNFIGEGLSNALDPRGKS